MPALPVIARQCRNSLRCYKKLPSYKQYGPVSSEELKNAYLAGVIDEFTLVTNDEMKEWCEFGDWHKIPYLQEPITNPFYDEFQKRVKGIADEPSLTNFLLSFGFIHIDPIKFEELILSVFVVLGFKGHLTPPSGDDGIDLFLREEW